MVMGRFSFVSSSEGWGRLAGRMESVKVLGLAFPSHPLTPNQTSGFCRIILTPELHVDGMKKKKGTKRTGWPSFLLKGVGQLPVWSD